MIPVITGKLIFGSYHRLFQRSLTVLCNFIIMNKVIAYQVADSIDFKSVKSSFKATLCYSDSSELFYETSAERYVYIFRYGVG
jgi:hypothetical protein